MPTNILKKMKTAFILVTKGNFREILSAMSNRIVRIGMHRIDKLNIYSYTQPTISRKTPPLKYKIATEEDMKQLFANWPDSEEERIRHHEVYFQYGFKRCFLFFNDKDNVVHFQFLITADDMPIIRKVLPVKLYTFLVNNSCASQEWIYTFEKYRRKNISILAMDGIIEYCKQHGITTIFSRRGITNIASVHMADRQGYVQIATAYQFQFFKQHRHQGFYFIKKFNR
jgi:GNAT superfamily N-acetyltransferase